MIVKELLPRMILIDNQRNAVVPRLPWIDEEISSRRFKMLDVFVAQVIKCLTKRSAPGLIPSRLASGLATAIANPSANAVRTTPGRSFAVRAVIDFNFEEGRI